MSESVSSPPASFDLERPAQPVWVVRPPRPRWWLHFLLLALTFFSTTVVGARLYANFEARQPVFSFTNESIPMFPVEWLWQAPVKLMHGGYFSFALMFILLAHEMGHYLYARNYRVYATPPFFIPFPSLIGTFGAFIRIKGAIPNRKALFDIGIAGPIAGFFPSCVAVFGGLAWSRPLAFHGADLENEPGFPLIFHLAARVLHLDRALTSLSLHPIAVAGWVGMFATALNLLPAGQLDGGHILFSISPKLHRWLSIVIVLTLIPLTKYFWIGWMIWAVFLWLTSDHPSISKYPALTLGRKWLAVFGVLMLVLSFTPTPFTNSSGQDLWRSPELREGWRDTMKWFRDKVDHALDRK
jgi:Zn-dependent protease